MCPLLQCSSSFLACITRRSSACGFATLAGGYLRQQLEAVQSEAYLKELVEGVKTCKRQAISRALTLCESTRPDHAKQAAEFLRMLASFPSGAGKVCPPPHCG